MQYIITLNGEVQHGPYTWGEMRRFAGLAGNKYPPKLPWEFLDGSVLEEYVQPVAEMTEEQRVESEKNSARTRLSEIDKASIRAIRAIQAGEGTPEDHAFLAELETEAATLRAFLKEAV